MSAWMDPGLASILYIPCLTVIIVGSPETGVKGNKTCISDPVAKEKQPTQLFHEYFCTLMLWLFGKIECFWK